MKIAIFYESYLGHTEQVARRIRDHLETKGQSTSLLKCSEPASERVVKNSDAVLIGSPIRAGKLHKKVIGFVRRNAGQLREKRTGLFIVCLAGKESTPEALAEIRKYQEQFVELTGLAPAVSKAFGGALPYPKYNFFLRYIMKKINQKHGGDIDTSRSYVYTDWDAVRGFAEEFIQSPVRAKGS